MPTEVRIYAMKPDKLDEFIDVFTNHVMPTSARYGVRVHAAWRDDSRNEFVWIRSYDDTATVDAYQASPERAEYTSKLQACIDTMDVRMVEAVVGTVPVANA